MRKLFLLLSLFVWCYSAQAQTNVPIADLLVKNIYLTGSATPCGWTNTNSIAMSPTEEDGVFTWEGTLKTGEFKFLLNKGAWNLSVNPEKTEQINYSGTFGLKVTDGIKGDYKFIVRDELEYNYTITVDTKNWTVEIKKGNIKVESIYLTGSATPCGWTNTNPIEMKTTEYKGSFKWTGMLKAGEFKFLLKKGTWNPSVNVEMMWRFATQDVHTGSYHLRVTDGINDDIKFIADRDVYCTIYVDTENWIAHIQEEEIENIYLTGSAMSCGWTNTNPIEMKPSYNNTAFSWEGILKPGEFKFLLAKGAWNQSVNPLKIQSVSPGVYNVKKTDGITGDYKFTINKEAYYSVKLDVYNWTVIIAEDTITKNIYLIGSATPCGWTNTNPIEMKSPDNDGIFKWEGMLKAGEFKFLLKKGVWNQSVNPYKSQAIGYYNGLYSLENTDGITRDYKFSVSTYDEGYYSIELNTKNWCAYVIKNNILKSATGTPEISSDKGSFTIISKEGKIEVTCNQGTMNRAKLLNINGVTLDAVTKEDKMYYLGSNLPKGVYIVEIVADGQRSVSKVLVK